MFLLLMLISNTELFNIYVFIALGLAVLGVVSAYIFEVLVMNASQRAIKKARDDIYQKINSISIKDFDSKYHGDYYKDTYDFTFLV